MADNRRCKTCKHFEPGMSIGSGFFACILAPARTTKYLLNPDEVLKGKRSGKQVPPEYHVDISYEMTRAEWSCGHYHINIEAAHVMPSDNLQFARKQ